MYPLVAAVMSSGTPAGARKCLCRHDDCDKIRRIIDESHNNIRSGGFEFRLKDSDKSKKYQAVLKKNLTLSGFKFDVERYEIAKHHFSADALQYFAGETDGKSHFPTTPVPAEIAKRHGFAEAINEFNGKYFWPPDHTIDQSRSLMMVLGGKSSRSAASVKRLLEADQHPSVPLGTHKTPKKAKVGNGAAAPITPACDTTGISGGSTGAGGGDGSGVVPIYDACRSGIGGHPQLLSVLQAGDVGRGVCSKYFSFTQKDGAWRSPDCSIFIGATSEAPVDVCDGCATVFSAISPDKYPRLYDEVGLVLPSAADLDLTASLVRMHSMQGEGFVASKEGQAAMRILRGSHRYFASVKLGERSWVNFCPSFGDASCGLVSLGEFERDGILCGPCSTERKNFLRRENRKQLNRAKQVGASSRAPIKHLTPTRLKERQQNQRKAARSTRDRLRCAKTKLESDACKVAFDLEKDGVMLDLFKTAADHVGSDHASFGEVSALGGARQGGCQGRCRRCS